MPDEDALRDALKDASGVRNRMRDLVAEMENPALPQDREDSHVLALKLSQLARGVETLCSALLKED